MNVRGNSSFIKTNYSSYYSPTRGKYSPWDENHAVHVISDIYAPVTKSRGWLLFVILFLFLIFCGRLQAHSCMNLNLCYCVIGMPSSSPEDILWYHFVAHNSLACIQLLDSSPNAMGPGGGGNISNPNLASRQRLRWTSELHERFVDAVTQLGGPDS